MPRFFIFILILIAFGFCLNVSTAGPLYLDRIYEPVIIYGSSIDANFRAGVPIDELYLCAYDAISGQWRIMPFQIDERKLADDVHDPYANSRTMIRHSYFFADDSVYDDDDELVFLCGDLGDFAPEDAWIEDAESHAYGRVQITVTDPLNPDARGYAYLYRSAAWKQPIPDKYHMSFDKSTLTVSTWAYQVRMDRACAMIRDITFLPPFGSGQDIFDTQKLRIEGYLYLNGQSFYLGDSRTSIKPPPSAANERDNLYAYPGAASLNFTQNPRVRVNVERWVTIKFGPMIVTPLYFPLITKFYPNSGTVDGGANLNKNELKKYFGTGGTYIINIDMLRESWDFNSNATGMRFYNDYNNGLLVDGVPDTPDATLLKPIHQWTLCTGEQGSLFTYTSFKDTTWKSTSLYFYDNRNGGYADGAPIDSADTGDHVSYGDQGFMLANSTKLDSITLELGFTAYFLPKNYPREDAQKIAQWVENPLSRNIGSYFQTRVDERPNAEIAEGYALYGNYPNPFNAQTRIRFHLPRTAVVRLSIVDRVGREVAEVDYRSFQAGEHEVIWNGLIFDGRPAASGVYFCRLRCEGVQMQSKLLLLR